MHARSPRWHATNGSLPTHTARGSGCWPCASWWWCCPVCAPTSLMGPGAGGGAPDADIRLPPVWPRQKPGSAPSGLVVYFSKCTSVATGRLACPASARVPVLPALPRGRSSREAASLQPHRRWTGGLGDLPSASFDGDARPRWESFRDAQRSSILVQDSGTCKSVAFMTKGTLQM